jgi:uncharacterized protein YcfL
MKAKKLLLYAVYLFLLFGCSSEHKKLSHSQDETFHESAEDLPAQQ